MADSCTVCGAGPRTRRLFFTVSAAGRLDSKCKACRIETRYRRRQLLREAARVAAAGAAQTPELVAACEQLERWVGSQRETTWRYHHKQRTRRYGGGYEPVNRVAVWNQSGGVCCLCDAPIGEGEPWTVDHLIPLALGGPHTLDNLAVAHRSCNSRKRARLRLSAELVWRYSEIVARQVRGVRNA